MVIEKIISSEEERRMLESIDWIGDEDTQNGGQNHRNPDLPYPYAVFSYSFSFQEVYILVNVLFEILVYVFLLF